MPVAATIDVETGTVAAEAIDTLGVIGAGQRQTTGGVALAQRFAVVARRAVNGVAIAAAFAFDAFAVATDASDALGVISAG
ncbi:MAG: hypothetical protein R2839_03920 [Thermomicrobiales bacterium]